MRRVVLLLAVILLSSYGCASVGPLYSRSPKPVTLEMASYHLTVLDSRSRAVGFSIPGLLGIGDWGLVSPQVDSALEERARQVIDQAREPGHRELEVTVELLVGSEQLKSDIFTKEEYVKWKLKVHVSEKSSQGPTLSGNGGSWGRRSSFQPPPGRLREMYLDSFAQALQEALSNLKEAKADH